MNRLPAISICTIFFAVMPCLGLAQEEDVKVPKTLSNLPPEYQDRAIIPYADLVKIAQSDFRVEKNAESYKLRIWSKNPTVKPEDIDLFLHLEDGPLVLAVDNDGYLEVPNRADLLEENPFLVTNQPKQTLNLGLNVSIPKFSPPKIVDGKVEYQELFRPLVEAHEELRKVNPSFGLDPGGDQFVLVVETGEEPIKITRSFGSRTFRPNQRGEVFMIMESYLYEENPVVEVPNDAKVKVIPANPEEVEDIRSR